MFKKDKEPWTKPFSEKIYKRVQKLPSQELEIWADNCINELGKCISGYLKTRNAYYLEEALTGAEALHAVIETLKLRDTLTNK
jgi:hypothetical protein